MQTKCFIHPDVDATDVCDACHRPFCPSCQTRLGTRVLCRNCLERHFRQQSRYSSFGVVALSFFPGAGHLYLGLPIRGLQLMLAVFGTVVLAGAIGLSALVPLAWAVGIFFSIFDAREAAHRLEQGLEVEDQPLYDVTLLKNPRLIGYALIAVGGFAWLRTLLIEFGKVLGLYSSSIDRVLTSTVVAALLIGAGIWLLRKKEG